MSLLDLQIEYNAELVRFYRASMYMDSDIPQEKKDKWLSEYEEVCGRLRALDVALREEGVEMTEAQVKLGFEVGEGQEELIRLNQEVAV